MLASGLWDHTVRLWDPAAREGLRILLGHTSGVVGVVFSSPNNRMIPLSAKRAEMVYKPRVDEAEGAGHGFCPAG